MSTSHAPEITLSERIAGKWQIPAFLLSVVLLVMVLTHVKSPDRKIPLSEHFAILDELNQRGLFDMTIARAKRLQVWQDLTDLERGQLDIEYARALFGKWLATDKPETEAAEAIVERYDSAQRAGASLSAKDERDLAKLFEQTRHYGLAVQHYEKAVELEPTLADQRRIIELNDYPLEIPRAELYAQLDAFIQAADDSPKNLLWALTRRVEGYADEGKHEQADALIEQYRDRFQDELLRSEYTYLSALALRGAGRYDEAERVLRHLLNTVSVSDPVYPKAGWLLGTVVMNDGRAQRPEESVAILRDVIASRADRRYVAAARVALAEALVSLQRFDQALDAYDNAIEDLQDFTGNRVVNRDSVRTSMVVAGDWARQVGWLGTAVQFEERALTLVDPNDDQLLAQHLERLSEMQVARARELSSAVAVVDKLDSDEKSDGKSEAQFEAHDLLLKAADNQVRLAWLSTLNERKSSEAMWHAAGLYEEAGEFERSIDLLDHFADERSDSEIMPQVLLRLGRLHRKLGQYADAIAVFQRGISSFPRSPHANASLVPLAECLMAMGADYDDQAEEALRRILDDSLIFTPAAPEYRDALYLLAELYARQQRHEDAIAILDEIRQRYPNDSRDTRAMFLLASAHFQSAQAIKDDLLKPEFAAEQKTLEVARRKRLNQAADLFAQLVQRLDAEQGKELTAVEQVYLQDGRLYEATALFELGRYDEALKRYERAAWLYKASPVSLGAYVQVINCDLILGLRKEAETALRRALFLVETIEDERFKEAGRFENRDQWRQYFNWVSETLLQR